MAVPYTPVPEVLSASPITPLVKPLVDEASPLTPAPFEPADWPATPMLVPVELVAKP